ncbi:hypothetical protein Droror1_Dr00017292, partial [Drosera rotundifolia]
MRCTAAPLLFTSSLRSSSFLSSLPIFSCRHFDLLQPFLLRLHQFSSNIKF